MNEIKYVHTLDIHNTKAAKAFIPVLRKLMQPNSVIDIGCGLGTWLKIFFDTGTSEIVGVDGKNVDKNMLVIPEEDFIEHDLRQPLSLNRKFDLAICLEVAEHLPNECADNIIDVLTNHSDNVIFSAALPFQGGQNHINEQPFSYWIKKFNERGFEVKDAFREIIWDNTEIEWWYKQNILLATKMSVVNQKKIHDYYHPEGYLSISNEKYKYLNQLNNLLEEKRKILSGEISVSAAIKILLKSFIKNIKN